MEVNHKNDIIVPIGGTGLCIHLMKLKRQTAEIADAIKAEMERQNSHIELIASENWVSKAVMAAMGSPLTNKYAEGYPGKRYYGGCECVDVVENLAMRQSEESYLAVSMQMFSHIPEHRQIWQYFLQC